MSNEKAVDTEVAIAALRLFPQKLRSSILDDSEFRDCFALGVDAVIRFANGGAELTRSVFFRAVRQVLSGSVPSVEITSRDETTWQVAHDSTRGITISRAGAVVLLPEFGCLSPDASARLEWFDQQTTKFRIADARISKWREALAERPLEDQEVDRLLDEFRLTPVHSASAIQGRLGRRNFSASDLVPPDVRYFDRLVGEPHVGTNVQTFISNELATHVRTLMEQHSREGLKAALLVSSPPLISELVDLNAVPREEVLAAFEWLSTS